MLDEIVTEIMDDARNELEHCHWHRHPFTPRVIVFRGGDEIAEITAEPGPTEQSALAPVLAAAEVGAAAFSADVIAMVSDSYMCKDMLVNPITGQAWRFGDMQDIVEHHHGVERGLISEALALFAQDRGDNAVFRHYPYRRRRTKIRWAAPVDMDMAGYVADALTEIMREVTVEQRMHTLLGREFLDRMDAHGVTDDDRRNMLDLASARMMTDQMNYSVALAAKPGSARSRFFDEHAEGMTKIPAPWSEN